MIRSYSLRRAMALLVFLCLVMHATLFAQSAHDSADKGAAPSSKSRPHHIVVNALLDYAIVRDKVISPLLYHAVQGGLTLGYAYRAAAHEHRVLLQMMGGTITRPELDKVPGGGSYSKVFLLAAQWSLEYSFAISLVRKSNWHLGLGGMVDIVGGVRTYTHIWAPVIGFGTSWNFGPSFVAAWQPAPRHNLRFRLAMPVMSVVKRPSWNLMNPLIEAQANKSLAAALYENPRLTSVHEWLRLSFELKHEWEITKLIQLNTAYRSTLLISSLPRFFGTFANQVSIGVSFRL